MISFLSNGSERIGLLLANLTKSIWTHLMKQKRRKREHQTSQGIAALWQPGRKPNFGWTGGARLSRRSGFLMGKTVRFMRASSLLHWFSLLGGDERVREWVRERSKTSSTSLCAVHACKRETACCCCVDVTHYNNYTHQHHYSRGELGKETSIFLLKLRSSRSSKNYLFSCFGHIFNDCEVLRRYVWKLFDVGKLSESFWATPRPLFCNFLTILLP